MIILPRMYIPIIYRLLKHGLKRPLANLPMASNFTIELVAISEVNEILVLHVLIQTIVLCFLYRNSFG